MRCWAQNIDFFLLLHWITRYTCLRNKFHIDCNDSRSSINNKIVENLWTEYFKTIAFCCCFNEIMKCADLISEFLITGTVFHKMKMPNAKIFLFFYYNYYFLSLMPPLQTCHTRNLAWVRNAPIFRRTKPRTYSTEIRSMPTFNDVKRFDNKSQHTFQTDK